MVSKHRLGRSRRQTNWGQYGLHIIIIIIIIIIKIYTALIDIETYNQSVKVSACEGIDRYTYTYIYTKPNIQYTIRSL